MAFIPSWWRVWRLFLKSTELHVQYFVVLDIKIVMPKAIYFATLVFISTFADSLSCMNAIQMRWGSTRYPYSLKTRMLFSCLVYTGRYIRLTRVLIKWRWTLGTMVILYSINLLQPLLEESFLVSIERSVVILFTPVGAFKFQTKRKISQILIGTICPHWETPQYTAQ